MRQLQRNICLVSSLCLLTTGVFAQANGAAAAGLAAGAALGASSSQSSSTPSTAGGSSAPIEMNIIVYGGVKQISYQMASDIDKALAKLQNGGPNSLPPGQRRLLLEDSTTMPLIALHATWIALEESLDAQLGHIEADTKTDLDAIKKIQDQATQELNDSKNKPAPPPTRGHEFAPNAILGLDGGSTTGTTGTSSGATGSGSSTTPIGLTYLGDIGTALSTAKNGITYSPSTVSPATQALSTALAKDLADKGVMLFTSASTINLEPATSDVTVAIIKLQQANARIQGALNVSTSLPILTAEQKKHDPELQPKIDTHTADIKAISAKLTVSAATANQLLTTFLSWQAGTDGNGGIILTDVIRGQALKNAIGDHVPALQFNIDAAGGNTRTNSYFLFNLFYTPKPSFNGGVVVTYELRDALNQYIQGDTLKAIYDYSKWKPNCFTMSQGKDVNGTSLGDGRSTDARQGHSFLCEVK